jgi:hypothetical protein
LGFKGGVWPDLAQFIEKSKKSLLITGDRLYPVCQVPLLYCKKLPMSHILFDFIACNVIRLDLYFVS